MTIRSLLPLFSLFFVGLPACGAASDSASGGDGIASFAQAGASNGSNGGKSSGAAGASSAHGSAGGSSSGAGMANAYAPPSAIWNSARSVSVTDSQLQTEYESWKVDHVVACANGSAVVFDNGTGKVESEGIGYGMLLAAAMGDQALFDALAKYYQDHLDKNGLMNWQSDKCDTSNGNMVNAATDADLDVAMALVQAAARWPSAGYLPKAQAQTSKILQFESEMCDGRRVLRPGDAYGGCSDPNNQKINPSYFSPGYYKVFAHYFPDQASSWTSLGDGSYQLYAIYQARMNNLVPDWSAPDGSDIGSSYSYDACRTPFRVAVDYAWSGDTRAKTFMQNVSKWVDQNGGLPKAAQQQNSAFIGAFALAGGYEQAKFDGYVNAWLNAKLDDAPYFQGSLRVLYLLVAAGKFSSTL